MLGFGPLGVEGADRDPALAQGPRLGHRLEERRARLLGDRPRQPQPPGHALGRDQDPRTEPAGSPERHHAGRLPIGPRKLGREVEDAAYFGAAESVDRLVRVADDREIPAVAGDRPEQRNLAGVGVLVLVDEDVSEPRPQLLAVGLGLDRGPANEIGVVGGALVVEVGEVLVEEEAGRDQLGKPLALTQLAQLRPVEPLLPGP